MERRRWVRLGQVRSGSTVVLVVVLGKVEVMEGEEKVEVAVVGVVVIVVGEVEVVVEGIVVVAAGIGVVEVLVIVVVVEVGVGAFWSGRRSGGGSGRSAGS